MIAAVAPLLLVATTVVALAVLVTRSLRDEAVVEGLRMEVRRVGETHRAVHEARSRAAQGRLGRQ